MIKQILKSKVLIVAVLILSFAVFYSADAFAWGGGGHGDHGHYYYRGGRWYNNGWFWGSFATGLAIGTIVATLPPYHETVYVRGYPYYYYDNVYYSPYPNGYVVVPAPAPVTVVTVPASNTVVAAPYAAAPVVTAPAVAAAVTVPAVSQPAAASSETAVINIPNANGGYTPVTLTKHNTGYLGPQGEYYEGHPTVAQLKVLYGK
jgi:hypothetical protein